MSNITRNQLLTRKTLLASLTAIYIGGVTSSTAAPGMVAVGKGNFYQPSFTADDVRKIDATHKASLDGDIFVGKPGQKNLQLKARSPEQIFQPDPKEHQIGSPLNNLKRYLHDTEGHTNLF